MGLFDILFGPKKTYRRSVNQITEKNIKKDWEIINVLLSEKSPSQLRNALITADRALDNALRDVVVGETMGDRLKEAEKLFDKNLYEKIWNAHKLRNTLVHEAGFEPPHFVLTEAVQDLRTAIRVLGIRV